jgi:sugar diacid utilization regulator
VGQRIGVEPAEMLEFVQSLIAWSDRAMVVTASAHRRAEFELARQQQEARGELVRGALLGTLAPDALRRQAQAFALDVRSEYITVRAELPTGTARSELERGLGFHETVHPRRGLVATLAGDLVGFSRDLGTPDTRTAVAVGPRQPLEHLAESFRLATRTLETMRAFELTGVRTLDDLGLLPAIVADAAVGDALVCRHVEPLIGAGASEIQASLLVYFDCQMHVERAAERLFVHPNTLRYRLARYEELTGSSLRDPLTAFEVWWALRRVAIKPQAVAGASSA